MDWYPLLNSLRIAVISAVIVFFAGIAAAYYIARLPRLLKGILDVVLTLPLVLPPTVVGYLLLCALGPRRFLGAWFWETFQTRLTMQWWSAVFAVTVVVFPLMYRTARGAFESFDETLAQAGKTLGLSNTYIFWRSMVAGYTPGRTATVATEVYQLWRIGDDALAFRWVMVNIAISAAVLLAVNLLERRQRG